MQWGWLPFYSVQLWQGLVITLELLVLSVTIGFVLAVPLAVVQIRAGGVLKKLATTYCNFMRGTPLLIQLWLLYYGVGSLFPLMPEMKTHFMWLIRLDAFYYAVVAFSLNFAGYAAEVLRGALLNVPRGELDAGRAIGMSPALLFRRIWWPRAVVSVLPVLAGEVISQLKSTPIAFTIPVMDLMGVASKIRQDTLLIYEPLLFVAVVYFLITVVITSSFKGLERQFSHGRTAHRYNL